MIEGKDRCAVDMVPPIGCGFIDRAIVYSKTLKLTRVHVTYSTLMSSALSGNWKRE